MDTTGLDPYQRITRIDEAGCWRRLLSQQLGRLAFVGNGRTELRPLNYLVRDGRIVMRTTVDAALLTTQEGAVPFEIGGWDRRTAWSVVARGTLTVSEDPAAFELEQEIRLAPWATYSDGIRATIAVLTVQELTGRWFLRREDEQERSSW